MTARHLSMRKRSDKERIASALNEAERRFHEMLENVALVAVLLDRKGRVVFANEFLLRLTGYRRDEVLGVDWYALLVPPDLSDVKREASRNLLAGRIMPHYENPIRTKAGELRLIRWSNTLLRDTAGAVIGTASLGEDITDRRRAEEALRRSEMKYRQLHETMMDAFVSVDMNGRIQESNSAYQQMLGYTEAELRQLSYMDLTPAKWHAIEARIVAGQIRPRCYSDVYEKEYRRKDGTVLPVELRTFLIKDEAGRPSAMWAIVRDITERKRLESELRASQTELRALANRLAAVEEEERARIARDLHDQAGQSLSALNMNLSAARTRLRSGATAQALDRIEAGMRLVTEVMDRLREAVADLRPTVLDDYGVVAALRAHAARFTRATGIAANVRGDESQPRLPGAVELALLRIAQEALTNVAKHARARRVGLVLSQSPGRVRLEIADNGVGFDPPLASAGAKQRHFGLLFMRERAMAAGGSCRVDSKPGAGTRVIVEFSGGAAAVRPRGTRAHSPSRRVDARPHRS